MDRNFARFIVISALAISAASTANAQGAVNDEQEQAAKLTDTEGNPLDGFNFGVGIGFENYRNSYINEAETVGTDRVVNVVDSQKQKPSLWLETHYIWDGIGKRLGRTHSAPGFYAGIRALGPDSDTFDAFSLGLLWSFKRTPLGVRESGNQVAESINIGVGPVWHRTKRLADGIVEGQPLPAAFQDVKFDKQDEVSWMLMLSVGF